MSRETLYEITAEVLFSVLVPAGFRYGKNICVKFGEPQKTQKLKCMKEKEKSTSLEDSKPPNELTFFITDRELVIFVFIPLMNLFFFFFFCARTFFLHHCTPVSIKHGPWTTA